MEAPQSAAVKHAVTFGDPRLPERFWACVSPSPNGCWIWNGTVNQGTPWFRLSGDQSVRRAVFAAFVAEPAGRVGTTCRVRLCCNPEHLRDTSVVTDEHKRERNRRWRAANAHLVRGKHYKYKYGISAAERDAKTEQQGNACAVCRKAFGPWRGGSPCTDHCHTSGAVRDILCRQCNAGLGNFRDRPDLLSRAISYLAKHNIEAEGE